MITKNRLVIIGLLFIALSVGFAAGLLLPQFGTTKAVDDRTDEIIFRAERENFTLDEFWNLPHVVENNWVVELSPRNTIARMWFVPFCIDTPAILTAHEYFFVKKVCCRWHIVPYLLSAHGGDFYAARFLMLPLQFHEDNEFMSIDNVIGKRYMAAKVNFGISRNRFNRGVANWYYNWCEETGLPPGQYRIVANVEKRAVAGWPVPTGAYFPTLFEDVWVESIDWEPARSVISYTPHVVWAGFNIVH